MSLIPIGLGVITGLQIVAAAAAYPILTLGVGLAVSVYGTLVSPDQGARTVFFLAGLPMAFGALLMGAVFAVVPLSVCVMGAVVLGRFGRRRCAEAPVSQLLAFGAVLVALNMVALTAGILFWPRWWYSEKLATLMPLWPLTACFALNALLDAALVGIVLRSSLRPARQQSPVNRGET
jgi:hypothetical protein